jgi:hypothetical protein
MTDGSWVSRLGLWTVTVNENGREVLIDGAGDLIGCAPRLSNGRAAGFGLLNRDRDAPRPGNGRA